MCGDFTCAELTSKPERDTSTDLNIMFFRKNDSLEAEGELVLSQLHDTTLELERECLPCHRLPTEEPED